MVDTTDSKSVASNRVRVQVSSPVEKRKSRQQSGFFLFNLQFRDEIGAQFMKLYSFFHVDRSYVFCSGKVGNCTGHL